MYSSEINVNSSRFQALEEFIIPLNPNSSSLAYSTPLVRAYYMRILYKPKTLNMPLSSGKQTLWK